MTAGEARALAGAKWRASGLTDAHARRLRLRALTPEQSAGLGKNFAAAAALKIPYFDVGGRPTKFFRVRYLSPLPGFAGQVVKPQRFAQESGALNEVYLPPLFRRPWADLSVDRSTPLYVTEGELKAAAGCAAGLAVVGLGGVDVWRASRRGLQFLPALEGFEWHDREVWVVYDSDAADNPDVVRAQRQLAQEVLARGARVGLVSLPPGPEGKKQGLDDFLLARGADALKELAAASAPFPESAALWQLNEEVLLVPKMGVVVERRSGDLITADRFVRVTHANRHYMETVVRGKQVSLVRKPLAARWVEWERRAEVERVTYAPGEPREAAGTWNVWPGWGTEPSRGDVGPWEWLMDFLFKEQVIARRWFERWLAYPLQHPGAKMYAACLLWSREQRVGKTLVAYAMKYIYGRNFVEIKSKDLRGNFNEWAKNRQFVYGDEIRGNDAKVDHDWLKGLITQDTVTIEEKWLPKYAVPDHMNYYFASNHPDALFLEDRDQRFLVHEVVGVPAERARYEEFDRWLHGDGPAHLHRHLLDLKLENFNPREHAPETPGKRSMIMLGKNDAALWVQALLDEPASALKPLGDEVSRHCDLYTPRQLHRAFDPDNRHRSGEQGLGRALASAGFRQLNGGQPMRTAMGLVRLYAVRKQVEWEQATRSEIAEHFDKFWDPATGQR